MLSALVSLGLWILGIFGFGKPDPIKQGEALGKAEAGQSAARGELADVQAAKEARDAASAALSASPDKLRDPDKFERP